MKIAIPTADGRLAMHFGHCEQFAIIEVDDQTHAVESKETLTPPPHEPGVLPRWLHEQGVNVIIAGGMGQRAQQLFQSNDIRVVVGAPAETPGKLVESFMAENLETGVNLCDH